MKLIRKQLTHHVVVREFWTKNKKPDLTRILVQDVIVQLQGITGALNVIHGNQFRHGDLKPENIVRQGTRDPDQPVCVGADLGARTVAARVGYPAWARSRHRCLPSDARHVHGRGDVSAPAATGAVSPLGVGGTLSEWRTERGGAMPDGSDGILDLSFRHFRSSPT